MSPEIIRREVVEAPLSSPDPVPFGRGSKLTPSNRRSCIHCSLISLITTTCGEDPSKYFWRSRCTSLFLIDSTGVVGAPCLLQLTRISGNLGYVPGIRFTFGNGAPRRCSNTSCTMSVIPSALNVSTCQHGLDGMQRTYPQWNTRSGVNHSHTHDLLTGQH